MFMPGQLLDGMSLQDRGAQAAQGFILCGFKWPVVHAFELYAYGVVVAVVAAQVVRLSGMPSPIGAGHELPERAVAADEEVGRNLQAADGLKVRVGLPVQLIGEQLLYVALAKLAGRQADGVNDDQVYR
jgi:hypothetical protein